jgi:hypothetical protein
LNFLFISASIRLDKASVAYFKALAAELGMYAKNGDPLVTT